MSVQNILPIIWVICSTISYVMMQVFLGMLSQSISTQYAISIRSILLIIFNSFLVLGSKQYEPYTPIHEVEKGKFFSLNIKNRKYFILMMNRLFWNAVSVNCFLSSLKYVHISIANALLNTNPVLTFFVEAFYYKKPINQINFLISVVSFIGVLVILNPANHLDSMQFNWYLLLPLIASFANSFNWIYLYEMRNQFKQIVVLEYTYVSHLIASSLVMLFVSNVHDSTHSSNDVSPFYSPLFYVQALFMAFFAYMAQFLRIKATFKRKPSQILAFGYVGLIFSIFVDVFYYKNHLKLMTIIGIFLTSAGLLSKIFIDLCNKEQQIVAK